MKLLAEAFTEGAVQAGHTVTVFEAGKKKITGCIACNTCFTTGYACSLMDDFNELAPVLENADAMVLCTPLYWFSFPGTIKSVIDKLYSFIIGNKKLKIKEAVLMVCAETDDMNDFKGILETYKLILAYQQWKDAGILIVPKVNKIGDIKNTGGPEKARNIGLNI